MTRKRKWITGIVLFAVVVGVTARILYVNAKYPYTHMTTHTMEEGVSIDGLQIRVDKLSLYTRRGWLAYLGKVAWGGEIQVPEGDMRELVAEITFTNPTQEVRRFNVVSIFSSVDCYNNGQDRRYRQRANELEGDNLVLAPGETRTVHLAYCLNSLLVPQNRMEALHKKSGYVYFMNFYDSHRIKVDKIELIE